MAIRLPLVIVSGQVQQLQAGDSLDVKSEQVSLQNAEAAPIVIGTPVYGFAAGQVKKGQANALSTSEVTGLVGQTSIANGASGQVTLDGLLNATTAQWDAVTGGSGGLVFNTRYYLDPATAGKLTATAPTAVGQVVKEIGVAMSTTDLKINIMPGILL
jgi:hypothetical protein